eukprot:10631571-Heterocapsa_arctica.AAC.1
MTIARMPEDLSTTVKNLQNHIHLYVYTCHCIAELGARSSGRAGPRPGPRRSGWPSASSCRPAS